MSRDKAADILLSELGKELGFALLGWGVLTDFPFHCSLLTIFSPDWAWISVPGASLT